MLLETARAFEEDGRWDVAEALYARIVARFPDTPAAATARARLEERPAADVAMGDGDVQLQVWSTLYGAWLGLAAPVALGAESSEAYGLGLLLGAPTGFFTGRAIARNTALTEGQASAVSLGAWWGTWQGIGWQEVFELGVSERCEGDFCYALEDSDEEAFTAAIAGGLLGIGAGALLARRDITPGTGTVMNFAPLWATWFGVAGGVLLGLEDDDLLAATLLAGDAGLITGALVAPGWNVSRSRARLVSIAGVLGGIAGVGVDLLTQPSGDKAAIAVPLAGSLLGLGLGIAATRDDAPAISRNGPDPAPAPTGSLLTLRAGRLDLDVPVPFPVRVPGAARDRDVWRTAFHIGIFRTSF